MSRALALQAVRDYLRTNLSLANADCDIEPGGYPPNIAGKLYVAIDEGGTTCSTRESLWEVNSVEVYVCRRPQEHPGDKRGQILKRTDLYLAGMKTLETLERGVIRYLHGVTAVPTAANALIAAILAAGGDAGGDFLTPLYYQRGGKMETFDSEGGVTWIRRQLLFVGMERPQRLTEVR